MCPTHFTPTSPSGRRIQEAIDRLKAKKTSLHLTNKQISEASRGTLSESAVQRFFSGDISDPSMQTFIEIASAIGMPLTEAFGDKPQESHACPHHRADHEICEKRIAEQKAHYEEQLSQCRTRYNERIADHKETHHREVQRLNKWLMFTSAAFIVLTVLVLTFTLIDLTTNDIGWVRYAAYYPYPAITTEYTVWSYIRRIFDAILRAAR